MGVLNLSFKACKLSLLAALFFASPKEAIAASIYQFSSFDYPGKTETAASDINNLGQIVGTYGDGASGFLYDGKDFTSFKPPASGEVFIPGINDNGQIVGGYFDLEDIPRGFIKEGDKYITINFPNDPPSAETALSGINDKGIAVGYYFDPSYTTSYAFSLDTKTNAYNQINIPLSGDRAYAWGINNLNQIVGSYRNTEGQVGYIYDKGNVTKLQFPGSSLTAAYGINDSGKVVGSFFRPETDRKLYAFAWQNGVFEELKYPGATGTFASAVDNSGKIVGYYFDSTGAKHAFIATPVPDKSAGYCVLAFTLVSAVVVRKKKLKALTQNI